FDAGQQAIVEDDRDNGGDRGDGDHGPRARRPGQHRDSALTPREMQARLRAGFSISEVADEAHVDEEWVGRFAAPIMAEQERVIDRALALVYTAPRKGPSSMALGLAVQLVTRDKGIAVDEDRFHEAWTAYQLRDSRWVVRYTYTSRRRIQHADWEVDVRAGTLTALNRAASELGYVDKSRRRAGLPHEPTAVVDEEAAVPPPAPPAPVLPAEPAATRKKPAAKRAPAAKKAPAKKATAKGSGARRAGAKRTPGAKEAAAKRPAARKAAAKRAPGGERTQARKAAATRARAGDTAQASTTAANKALPRKAPANKAQPARKPPANKAAARKAPARKPPANKAPPAKKAPARRKAVPQDRTPSRSWRAEERSTALGAPGTGERGHEAEPMAVKAARPQPLPARDAPMPAAVTAPVPPGRTRRQPPQRAT
ncbi:MAG: hypothetical protein QOG64_1010, partial [Acidimicrobiaceae bacterium]|nr:hypothetical protein [Acidimicrobiaceae bacterium]